MSSIYKKKIMRNVFTKCISFGFLKRFMSKNSGSDFHITGTIPIGGPKVGATAELRYVFTQDAVNQFASISGDNNPLHLSLEFARKSFFEKPIVHGILVSSLFSCVFGRSVAGSIYISQTVNFRKPVYVGMPITASIKVLSSENKNKGVLLTCSSIIRDDDGNVFVDGEARVMVPHK